MHRSAERSPVLAGVGLKPAHYRTILEQKPKLDFFEVHAENFMGAGGPPHRYLAEIRGRYELSIHGVGLSLGGARSLDVGHLERLAGLVDRYAPALVSEHLAWSSHEGSYFGDLLPVPYTAETLERLVSHVGQVQDRLKRRLLVENPSTYLRSACSTMSESEFLAALAARSGCGLLLDVNNIHVSATNHGVDAGAWIDEFPFSHVEEIHLAGHTCESDEFGRPLLIDTHDKPVCDAVWRLYARALAYLGPCPTLIEWDSEIPAWEVLHGEALRAEQVMAGLETLSEATG